MSSTEDQKAKQAEVYKSQGRIFDAMAIYESLIATSSNPTAAHFELAKLFHSQGWLELAIPHYSQALSGEPQSFTPESHIFLGDLWRDRGSLSEAIACYKTAINLNSNLKSAYMAWLDLLIRQQNYGEVTAVLEQMAEQELLAAKDYSDLGIRYMNMGKVAEAIAQFEQAISHTPDHVDAHCNLGNALTQLGRYRDAVLSYREALSIDPNFAEVYYNLGIVLTHLNLQDEAIACFEAAVALKPQPWQDKPALQSMIIPKLTNLNRFS